MYLNSGVFNALDIKKAGLRITIVVFKSLIKQKDTQVFLSLRITIVVFKFVIIKSYLSITKFKNKDNYI